MSKIVSFQIQLLVRQYTFFFFQTKPPKSFLYFRLPAHFNLDQPHFNIQYPDMTSVYCIDSMSELSHFSRVWLLATPWTVAYQAPLSTEFSRQEYQSGLPCPPPGDLLNPGIKPASPALQADSLPLSRLYSNRQDFFKKHKKQVL